MLLAGGITIVYLGIIKERYSSRNLIETQFTAGYTPSHIVDDRAS